MAAAITLILSGCASGGLPWAQGPQLSESECTASCDTHYKQCPQVFASFPERGAVECPAERNNCLKRCETNRDVAGAGVTSTVSRPSGVPAAAVTPVPAVPAAPSVQHAVSSKEARLRELKHLYDEGLVTDDVYKERQRAILSEP